jgi:cyclopropane-fatty-acyl-phospholipid synthase
MLYSLYISKTKIYGGKIMSLASLIDNLVSRLVYQHGRLPFSFVVHTVEGVSIPIGDDHPAFEVYIRNQAGLKAIQSLNELKIAEAYIKGDLDVEGDLIKLLHFRDVFLNRNIWLKKWRNIAIALCRREKCNPNWIAKHYDSDNAQLLALDYDYHLYTQGIYVSDEDNLEAGAERKLESAFQALNLKPNDSLLDVGCGWGGFLRYVASRGIHVTGITLSHNQKQYTEALIRKNHFDAKLMYQDCFSFQPSQKYDAIAMMGVMEHLFDYSRVIKQVSKWIKPGGRIYLDFASAKAHFDTSFFITKYIWPGTFRMVFMPLFIDAVRESPFEIISINNDRYNYYLWSKWVTERWEQKKIEIIEKYGEELWRIFRILYAGTASIMDRPSHYATAYRVVLEYPADFVQG